MRDPEKKNQYRKKLSIRRRTEEELQQSGL